MLKKLFCVTCVLMLTVAAGCGGGDQPQAQAPSQQDQPPAQQAPQQQQDAPQVNNSIGRSAQQQMDPVSSDDFKRIVDMASSSFEGGNFQQSFFHLQDAMKIARANREIALKTTFPPAPAGFTREDAKLPVFPGMNASPIGIAPMMKYSKGNQAFMVTITTDSPNLSPMIKQIMKPQAQQGNAEFVQIAGLNAKVERNGQQTSVRVEVADKALITISSQQFDADFLTGVAETMDFASLRRMI